MYIYIYVNIRGFNISTEIDEDFVVYVKELVPCILSEESLVAKQINYMEVSGNILMKYIEVSKIVFYCFLGVITKKFTYKTHCFY